MAFGQQQKFVEWGGDSPERFREPRKTMHFCKRGEWPATLRTPSPPHPLPLEAVGRR